MKKSLFLFAILFLSFISYCQHPLVIHNDEKGIYLVHKVAPKEGIYALGRMYAISPKEIAAFNNMDVNSGLTIGKTILIPLTETNFSQSKITGTPVYYVVGEKEGLYRVSVKNGKVLMADLRKWNNLTSDAIKSGQKIIVGYLTPSEAATTASITPSTIAPSTTEIPLEKPSKTVVKSQASTAINSEKKVETVAPPAATEAVVHTATNDGNGGYFKKQFEQQSKSLAANKDLTATSGIFKTSSGWQDAKYYALVDGIDPGTIVRVINPSNNKVVYAKVLGGMTGIRQNQGYEVRISNAAASVLEVKDTDKFIVKVNY